jgi:radical SAM superfamily enzyme YgiQ (UPF0313 family)
LRILFVYPDNLRGRNKPIGIALLSAVVKARGHEAEVFEQSDYLFKSPGEQAGVDLLMFKRFKYPPHLRYVPTKSVEDGFRQVVADYRPDLIAVSVNYLMFSNGLHLVRALGKRDVPTIFGGIHVTLNPEEVIAHDEVDMICLGEGEDAFAELVDAMAKGMDITGIPNIWIKREGTIYRNAMRPLRTQLDDLPLCDWSLFPEHHFYKPFVGRIYRGGDLMTSRGCYNSCSYCFYDAYYKAYGTRKHRVSFMSPARAMAEIEQLARKYRVNLVKLRDSDFAARSEEDLREMVRIRREMGPDMPRLLCNVYHKHVTREKVRLWRELNIVAVSIGLESGSDEIRRKYLNRRADNEKFFEVCRWIRHAGMRLTTANMMGLPCETRSDIFKTFYVNKKAKVDLADFSILYPFPGTAIHEMVREMGFLKRELSEQTYYRGEAVLDMPQISREELQGLMRTCQMYIQGPRWFYPFIRPAEQDTPMGRAYFRVLRRFFYPYIFYVKPPLRKLGSWCEMAFGQNGKA